jgi:hypothetical protein
MGVSINVNKVKVFVWKKVDRYREVTPQQGEPMLKPLQFMQGLQILVIRMPTLPGITIHPVVIGGPPLNEYGFRKPTLSYA